MFKFPEAVLRIIRQLNDAGFEAYAVGGCVRDALLDKQPNDWDLTTSALPDEIKRVFKKERVIETGIQHGTVTVLINGEGYEITTYRVDGEYTDHRRPDSVHFVSNLKDDLMRRDFTVNAMAAHPNEGVIDLFGGKDDLKNGVIRAVGNPEMRFTEDALRILRAVRFASTYDFTIDEETALAANRLAPTLENVSEERIFVELKKLLCGKGAERILLDYPEIIFTVLPELKPMYKLPQINPHHVYDVWTHTVKTVAAAPSEPVYRLTMLLHDAGKPEKKTTDEKGVDHFIGHPVVSAAIAEKTLLRLKSDRATIQTVTKLVLEHDLRVPEKRINIRRQISRIGKDLFPMLTKVIRADFYGQNPEMLTEKLRYVDSLKREYECAIEENACLTLRDLLFTGRDLLQMGAKGKTVGIVLEKLLDDVIREKVQNETEALKKRAVIHLKNLTENP
ncbi:MAG: CCA tRNA nucleotidyltransferase [Clostridia bacterium]|nr:CCA tRNA nucleotidyltransferase [Clostridia bacterium]